MMLIRPLQEAIKSSFGRHRSREQAKPTTGTPKAILGDQSDDQSRIQLIASKDIIALGSYLVSDRILSSSVKLQKSEYFFC